MNLSRTFLFILIIIALALTECFILDLIFESRDWIWYFICGMFSIINVFIAEAILGE